MFAGYNKHRAEWIIRNRKLLKSLLTPAAGLLSVFKGSRNSFLSNRIRQLHRFSEGAAMTAEQRYWRWCGFTGPGDVSELLLTPFDTATSQSRISSLLRPLSTGADINDVLFMDMHMVLPDDMLVKVDRMSMAHALEVRSPFMDMEVVNLAFSLHSDMKIDSKDQKKILKDTFQDILPAELLTRRKQGFEIPLLRWLRKGLDPTIKKLLLDRDFIVSQGIFRYETILSLYKQLHSGQPGDSTARVWGLLVFQYWWKKYFEDSQTQSQ
jgi:asparagine synthase (glutamine-hydrolysing)